MKTPVLTVFALFGSLALSPAQTISNPSFESNSFTVWPGYISSNAPIVGWTTTDTNRAGLNPVSGGDPNPFADNSAVPDGNNVAFIQSGTNSSLSTVISNLTAHKTYTVTFRVNARSYNTPNLDITVGGKHIINTAVTPVSVVGFTNIPYNYFAFDFTAAERNETMTLLNHATGDNTVLVDDFSIAPRKIGWSYAPWKGDTTSGVVKHRLYTHAYNFGSTNNAVINGVTFTGIAGPNPSNSLFSTAGLPTVFNNDTNQLTTGRGGSAVLAGDFVLGDTPGPESITIDGLTVGYSYVATIYSVGFRDTNNGVRAATFNAGNDYLTVNQDQFGLTNGIRVSYAYTATARSLTLTYVPLQEGGQPFTFHTYGFANYLVSRSGHAAFLIVTNPADSGPGTLRQVIANANPGDTITFGRSLSGQTILLTNGQLTLYTNVTIDASSLPAGVTVSGNHASRIFEVSAGTTVTLDSLTLINGNSRNGGAIYVDAGGTLTLNNSTLSGNSANNGDGGGIVGEYGSTLTLNSSTLSSNTAADGGGIFISNNGTLEVNNSTLSGNSANNGDGGGIANANARTTTLNNTTLSGNSATNGGGGIFNVGALTLNNSTLSGNSAGDGGGISVYGQVWLTNTIVAGNSTGSADTNIYINSGSLTGLTGLNNLTNGDPHLAPLGNYGGPTQTMPPLPGSPAIDAGDDSVTNFLATDQRGFPRLSGKHVDIGSVEVQVRTAAQVIPGGYQFSDPAATNDPQRFYRATSP